ncbi:hypothetical protein J8N05_46965 (plasmid) [Streptomyces sp. BH-SS-21]|uniref:Uncharacterized protein n=1 Tax=Streptomyces liliiviolaceus TaxID=2823109 RepID=A0A941BEX2_9ACTN|nr:hypothetical protein [Streptomyces liliiviolaceus]MBQ0855703.1 hypothetical protein [Streptomyces liliiviolaceus]
MKTYQIEIKNADKIPVKRFYFDIDEQTAYDMFDEWAARYDSSHKLELSNRRTGKLLPEGRQSGYAEWMDRDLTEWENEFVAWT